MITFNVTSIVYSDAPTSSTASTRSVTFGSMFNIQCSIFNSEAFGRGEAAFCSFVPCFMVETALNNPKNGLFYVLKRCNVEKML